MSEQRTYWHLEGQRRVPTDYDITSSRLLYTHERGFAVNTPAAAWTSRFGRGSRLTARDWESFADPLRCTYAEYVARQAERERFVESLLRSVEGTDHDRRLRPEWRQLLDATLPVLRFPCHGLQMVSAYVAHLAPASRLVILGLFQVGDEMRRVQSFAYRMRQLMQVDPQFGASSKETWLTDSAWQPLRRTLERLLVTYDFGEAFVALNLVLKPAFDAVFLSGLAQLADDHADVVLEKLLFSLAEDARWHHLWSRALVRHVIADTPSNVDCVSDWIERWRAPVEEALRALSDVGGASAALLAPLDAALAPLSLASLSLSKELET